MASLQERGGSRDEAASDSAIKLDAAEAEGLSTTCLRSIREIRVLSGTHEPEEGDDDEVEDGGFGDALVMSTFPKVSNNFGRVFMRAIDTSFG